MAQSEEIIRPPIVSVLVIIILPQYDLHIPSSWLRPSIVPQAKREREFHNQAGECELAQEHFEMKVLELTIAA